MRHMPRKSKIDQAGVGDKVIEYHLAGFTLKQVAEKVNREHELNLSPDNVLKHLQRQPNTLDRKRSHLINSKITWTLDEVRKQLADTVVEIREYIEEHKDDPRAVGTFLKVRLDALDKIAKLLGGYPSEHPTVNVQVNNLYSREAFEKSLADAEAYFEALEMGGEHSV